MDAIQTTSLPVGPLIANLAVLARRLPAAARLVEQTDLPASAEPAAGRDGSPTVRWTTPDGRLAWLGRTTMPRVRADAMVASFEAGAGNALLVGIGQGAEVDLLLRRLGPHQAVFVVEEDAAAANLALRLYDWTAAIDAERLVLFVGAGGWDDMRAFLLARAGYLSPQRVLSWPHFGHEQVHEISTRLSSICSQVGDHRAARRAELAGQFATRSATPAAAERHRAAADSPRCRQIAILCGGPSPAGRALARRLAAGAAAVSRHIATFDYTRPDLVHPLAIEEAMARAVPDRVILIDAAPAELPCRLPDSPVAIVPTHAMPLPFAWLATLPSTVRLVARSAKQRQSAIDGGFDPARIDLCLPAAVVDSAPSPLANSPSTSQTPRPPCGRGGIAVLAAPRDASAAAAGLHLETHVRLYESAARLARERVDDLTPEAAAALLADSQRRAGFTIDSDTVRDGLLERIRQRLIPAVVAEAFVAAAQVTDAAVRLVDEDDRDHGAVAREWAAGDVGLLIVPDAAERRVDEMLDAMAADVCVAVRRADSTVAAVLGDVLDPAAHLATFASRRELAGLIERFRGDPRELAARAAAAGAHIRAAHTWSHRVESLLR